MKKILTAVAAMLSCTKGQIFREDFGAKFKVVPIWSLFGPRGENVRRCLLGKALEDGPPERIRTSDLCLRRAALYPAELRADREPHNTCVAL